jgi:hypothetical protein
MTQSRTKIPVYLEVGSKRTFAGAIHWPGWCRSGRDEAAALDALVAYGSRYARVLQAVQLAFEQPLATSDLTIEERLVGTGTTDFGAPAMVPSADEAPIDDEELDRLQAVLRACWLAFHNAVRAAEGRSLRKGPRGGGRDLPAIVEHVQEANKAYLSAVGWKPAVDPQAGPEAQLDQTLEEPLRALAAGAAGDLAERGPRGGKRWVPRYFARRTAWHVLDHAWEIEDRVV